MSGQSELGASVETVELGGQVFRVPYAHLLRPLTEDEYRALRESVSERGIVNPIVITEDRVVLDGYHRLRIAAELGLAPSAVPVVVVPYLDDADRLAMAVMLNAQRRQLQPEDLRQLVISLRRTHRMSYRQIERVTGVPRATVYRWCSEEGLLDDVDRVVGLDGREYAAQKQELVAERRQAVWNLAQEGLTAEEIADRLGITVRTVLADLSRGQLVMTTAQRVQRVGDLLERGAVPSVRVARDGDVSAALRRQAERGDGETERDGMFDVFVGDPARHLADLPPDTIDLAFVEALDEVAIQGLANVCAQLSRVVQEGGSVFVLTTPARVPDVLAIGLQHLRYRWILVGRARSAESVDIASGYRPIVWLSRGRPVVSRPVADMFDWNHWRWSYLVGKLSEPGMTIAVITSSVEHAELVRKLDRVFLFLVPDESVARAIRAALSVRGGT